MTITRWAAVVDAVIAAVDAGTSATVFDAEQVTDDFIGRGVVIGARAERDERGFAGSINQAYHDLGPTATRDETGTIHGYAWAQTGDNDVRGVRNAVVAIVGEVETALRDNYDLDVLKVRSVELLTGDVYQGLSNAGSFAQVEFTIRYEALI